MILKVYDTKKYCYLFWQEIHRYLRIYNYIYIFKVIFYIIIAHVDEVKLFLIIDYEIFIFYRQNHNFTKFHEIPINIYCAYTLTS